jgi:excisionase family DNA binding protein
MSETRETGRLISTAEAAARLGLSISQVRKKANAGQIPAIRLGPPGGYSVSRRPSWMPAAWER